MIWGEELSEKGRQYERLTDQILSRVWVQDDKHGPFDRATSVASVRLAIACLEDEIKETKKAWRKERKAPHWNRTCDEALDVAAIAFRILRDIEDAMQEPS